jgi:hypothetical protein
MNLQKIGKVFTSKFVGTGPSSYEERIYGAAVSQRLRNTVLNHLVTAKVGFVLWYDSIILVNWKARYYYLILIYRWTDTIKWTGYDFSSI